MKKTHSLIPALCLTALASAIAAPLPTTTQTAYDTASQYFKNGDYQTPIKILKPLAEAGDPRAQKDLGMSYIELGNTSEGLKWLNSAIKLGNIDAMGTLASFYVTGFGVPKDIEKAKTLLKQAAEKGDLQSEANYGAILAKQRQCKEAFYWLNNSIDSPISKANLANLYITGCTPTIPVNHQKAFSYMVQAVKQGYPDATFLLGEYYFNGIGTQKDLVKAYVYLRLAANLPSSMASVAQNNLGALIHNGYLTQTQIAQGKRLFDQAYKEFINDSLKNDAVEYQSMLVKDKNDLHAKVYLGATYLQLGQKNKGLTLLTEAANAGDSEALLNLARAYDTGMGGVSKDHQKAEALYLQAAKKGNVLAQSVLGSIALDKKDYQNAEYWSLQSQDLPASQFNLGIIYERALGVEKNEAKAKNYFIQAAKTGYVPALEVMGLSYAKGNPIMAYVYLKFACAIEGDKQTIAAFNSVAEHMTKDQLDTAEKEFNMFAKAHKNILMTHSAAAAI